jgi:hypothetical protein
MIEKFPTLRNAILTPEKIKALQSTLTPYSKHFFGKIIYFATGQHITHESKSGGIFSMGKEMTHPAISFEVQIYLHDNVKGRKRPLYLLVWVGGYTKGSIFHCGFQYPHNINFDKDDQDRAAKAVYHGIARFLYNEEIIDKDIVKFLK